MDTIYILLIILSILFNVVFFILGQLYIQKKDLIEKPISFINKHKTVIEDDKKNKKESIDESKYVTKINTNNMEILYDSLGTTQSSSENIESSINKLKNMKG